MPFEADFNLVPTCGETRAGTFLGSKALSSDRGILSHRAFDREPQKTGTVMSKSIPARSFREECARNVSDRESDASRESWLFILEVDCLAPTCCGEETEVGAFLVRRGIVPSTARAHPPMIFARSTKPSTNQGIASDPICTRSPFAATR